MADLIRRRDVIAIAAGAAAAPFAPWVAKAQQRERMRRIGVLLSRAENESFNQNVKAAFHGELQKLGWTIGRNVQIDHRWSEIGPDLYRKSALELMALNPDIVFTDITVPVRELQKASSTVPIVFYAVVDPVGGGLVASMARPGGNATGFMTVEFGFAGKWLELLKDLAPRVTRVAVLRNPTATGNVGQFAAIQAVAPSLRVELTSVDPSSTDQIERGLAAFARGANGGLVVPGTILAYDHRDLIIALAAKYRLPAVYPDRAYVAEGGLISYGIDIIDNVRRAAGYVDRILRGERPANLPVQAPTRFQTVLNLKTAKTLGLEVPPIVLVGAEEVIE
jgi:putative tryptophan/tyrosine transport system substrate-binding protein